jgi:hypothetical protein
MQSFVIQDSLNLAGTLPDSLGKLSVLKHLRVVQTSLSGAIYFLNSHVMLSTLNLAENKFNGEISQFFRQPGLVNLNLSHNSFSGSLPAGWDCSATRHSLAMLDIAHNQLSGHLPDWLSCLTDYEPSLAYGVNITGIQALIMSNNQFSGTIPTTFTELSTLKVLLLDDNSLRGKVPSLLGRDLRVLSLDNNKMSGNLADFMAISSTSALEAIVLNDNKFSGSFPQSFFENVPNLKFFSVTGNCLVGKIPDSVCLVSEINTFILSGVHTKRR